MFLIILIVVALVALRLSTYSRFYALLFLIPLSVYSQSSTVISTGERGVNLGMDTIYIFVLIVVEFAKGKGNKFKTAVNGAGFALLLCFVYFFFNALVSSLIGPIGFSVSGLLVYVRLVQYVPIFILLSNIKIDFKQALLVVNTFIWTGISGALLAIYQFFSGKYFYMKGMPSFTMPVFREANVSTEVGLYAGSGNYNVYAAFLLIPILLTIIMWYCRKEIPSFTTKRFLVYMLILLAGLYVSNSKAAMVAVIVGVISMNFSKKMLLSSLKTVFSIIVVIIVVGYIFREQPFIKNFTDIFYDFNDALPYAMANITYDSSMGFSGDTLGAVVRVFGYAEAIRVFLIYPVLGCGFDLFLTQSVHYPENLFLQILAETGIVGLCLYINFTYRMYKDVRFMPQTSNFNKYYASIFQAIIIAMILVNMTGATLLIQKVWGPFLLIAGCYYGYQRSTVKELILTDAK